jgi:cation:H+ antiporter
MLFSVLTVLIATVVIWWFSNKLEDAAHSLGEYLRLPSSVKGAILYAVPSSFPEFATAIFAVLWGDKPEFGIGLGTIAGSAVFNILLIPALSVLAATTAIRKSGQKTDSIYISPRIFVRDGIFYLLVVIAFICVVFSGEFKLIYAWLFLGGYVLYVGMLYVDTRRHRESLGNKTDEEDSEKMSLAGAITWMIVSMGALGIACFYLVQSTITISHALGVNSYVVAVVLTAAATSIPDTLISIAVARKGGEHAEDAIVNAFSSNIFDILICLSVPVLLYGAAIPTDYAQSGLSVILLAVCTIVTLILCKTGNRLTRVESWFLIAMYVLFVGTAIMNDRVVSYLLGFLPG